MKGMDLWKVDFYLSVVVTGSVVSIASLLTLILLREKPNVYRLLVSIAFIILSIIIKFNTLNVLFNYNRMLQ